MVGLLRYRSEVPALLSYIYTVSHFVFDKITLAFLGRVFNTFFVPVERGRTNLLTKFTTSPYLCLAYPHYLVKLKRHINRQL